MTTLRWLQPEPPPADAWRVYRDGQIAKVVVVEPDAEGVRSVELDPWPTEATYWLTAVNVYGESPPSQTVLLPEPPVALGLLAVTIALYWLKHRRRPCA